MSMKTDFLDLVKKRRSVRQYLPKEVESEKLDYILECTRLAPSAANLQPLVFFLVTSEQARAAVEQSYPRNWFISYPAPVFIVACSDKDQSWKRSYDQKDHGEIDVAIAFEHLCLAAAEQGLGTCWICHFDCETLRKGLDLPDNLVPIAITPLGYPDESNPKRTLRKTKEEIFRKI
jgi:nitroreductase